MDFIFEIEKRLEKYGHYSYSDKSLNRIYIKKVEKNKNLYYIEGENEEKEYKTTIQKQLRNLYEHNGFGIVKNKLNDCIVTNIGMFSNGSIVSSSISIKYPYQSIYLPTSMRKDKEAVSNSKECLLCNTFPYSQEEEVRFKDTQVLISNRNNNKINKEDPVFQIWVEDDGELKDVIKKVSESYSDSIIKVFSLYAEEINSYIDNINSKKSISIRIFYGYVTEIDKSNSVQKGILISRTSSNLTIYKGTMTNFQANTVNTQSEGSDEESFYYDEKENVLYIGIFEKNVFIKGMILTNPMDNHNIKTYEYSLYEDILKKNKFNYETYMYYFEIITLCNQTEKFTMNEQIFEENLENNVVCSQVKDSFKSDFIKYAFIIFIKCLSIDSCTSFDLKFIVNSEYTRFIDEVYNNILVLERFLEVKNESTLHTQ